jgi:hypothetical protein
MKDILELFKSGAIDENETSERILKLFYSSGEEFMLDLHRTERLGFPEVVLAEGKSVQQVLEILERLLEHKSLVIVSNVDDALCLKIENTFKDRIIRRESRILAIGEMPSVKYKTTAGIITAGTSDIPYAKECALILECAGFDSISSFDAGIAGIHRPFMSLRQVSSADVLIILAGMEGALPSVIASLTDKPVIAVPTPVGYGIGGKGIGAMISMLQTCAPGIVTVNIGNTIGASAAAIRILRSISKINDDGI